jgi:hypothetical protein
MDASKRRLFVVAGHFDVNRRHELAGGFASRLDVKALQDLLDHDNIELRQRMKDFLKDEIYIP